MSAGQAMFDFDAARVFPRPTARTKDPTESKLAAASIEPANQLLVVAIRQCIKRAGRPLTQFQIADRVYDEYEGRWNRASIRTACARSGLEKVGSEKIGSRSYGLYDVPSESQRQAS